MTLAAQIRAVAGTVARSEAAARLNVGQRQLRGLIASGRLMESGVGQQARITTASLDAEVSRRAEKRQSSAQKAAIFRIHPDSPEALPQFESGHLEAKPFSGEDVSEMFVRFPRTEQPSVARLLSLAAAASLLGVSDKTLRTAAETGQLPTVLLGARRKVAVDVLRSWSRGSYVVEIEKGA